MSEGTFSHVTAYSVGLSFSVIYFCCNYILLYFIKHGSRRIYLKSWDLFQYDIFSLFYFILFYLFYFIFIFYLAAS